MNAAVAANHSHRPAPAPASLPQSAFFAVSTEGVDISLKNIPGVLSVGGFGRRHDLHSPCGPRQVPWRRPGTLGAPWLPLCVPWDFPGSLPLCEPGAGSTSPQKLSTKLPGKRPVRPFRCRVPLYQPSSRFLCTKTMSPSFSSISASLWGGYETTTRYLGKQHRG